jgi:hypothetical protein
VGAALWKGQRKMLTRSSSGKSLWQSIWAYWGPRDHWARPADGADEDEHWGLEHALHHVAPSTVLDPPKIRAQHRISLVRPLILDSVPEGNWTPLHKCLGFGRLGRYLEANEGGSPLVMAAEHLAGQAVSFPGCVNTLDIAAAHVLVIHVNASSCVLVLTIDLTGNYVNLIDALDAGYAINIEVSGQPLASYVQSLLFPGSEGSRVKIGYERHQLVYYAVKDASDLPDFDTIQRLVYRADLPALPEHCSFVQPAELNRRPTSLAYLGAYVSVLTSQQDYIENAVLLSAMIIVSAAARLRMLKQHALKSLEELRSTPNTEDLSDRRSRLARLAAELRDLQVSLSFDVEDASTIGDLIPSLRVEAFHEALWDSTQIADEIRSVSQMLARLENAVNAEEQAIGVIQQKKDDWRRIAVSIPVGFISLIAIPVTILLTFVSGNQAQVYHGASIFSWHYYGWLYAAIIATMLWTVLMGGVLWSYGRRAVRRMAKASSR